MVKFESVVKNNNDSISSNGIFFVLEDSKINYVCSDHKKQLQDVFNIITGFYKPNIGGIIYDDYDLNQFNLHDKAYFIRKNIAIVLPFDRTEKNMKISDYLYMHTLCIYKEKQERIALINQVLKEFDLEFFKSSKIKTLSNQVMIKLLLANAKLSNPKYLYFYGIEQYLSTKKSYMFFIELLQEKFDLNQLTTTIFINQSPSVEISLKNHIDYKIINLDNLDTNNDQLFVRDKKIKRDSKFSKNFFSIFKYVFKTRPIINLSNLFIFLLLGLLLSISICFYYDNKNNKVFLLVFLISSVIGNFIFALYNSMATYFNIKNKIFVLSRWGVNIVECLLILIFYITLILITYFIIFLTPLFVYYYYFKIDINWTLSLSFLVFISLVSFVTFVVYFAFSNRRMIKIYDKNW